MPPAKIAWLVERAGFTGVELTAAEWSARFRDMILSVIVLTDALLDGMAAARFVPAVEPPQLHEDETGRAWWRTGDGRFLLAGYALGLVGVVLELYLVYLELFVINAICTWCMAYGATVVLGWLALLVVQRRAGRAVGEG